MTKRLFIATFIILSMAIFSYACRDNSYAKESSKRHAKNCAVLNETQKKKIHMEYERQILLVCNKEEFHYCTEKDDCPLCLNMIALYNNKRDSLEVSLLADFLLKHNISKECMEAIEHDSRTGKWPSVFSRKAGKHKGRTGG